MNQEIENILKRLERLEAKETPTVKPVDLSAFVDLTSNQSVGGVKTFTSIPLLPSSMPTLNNQAANKAYVDSVAGGGGVTDHGALTGLEDNDHPQYLLTTGKASDSDKLDGVDSTGFVKTTGTQTVGGTKTFSSIPVLPASNPTAANQAVRKGYADGAYLGINGKAADSDKLDGLDSTAFGRPVFLTTPLTSTSWDGDAYSTTAKTLIDLSSVFGAPAGIKGIFVKLAARDSGSSAGYCQLGLSPNSTAYSMAIQCYLQGVANDVYVSANGIVPCNANGDIYYQITASGTGTLDAFIEIWGYWL